jgi:adenylate cyclase class 2
MEIEYEATFTNIDKDEIRRRLASSSAKLIKPEFMQKRVVFDLPTGHEIKGGWLRVRDEGDKITMSLKIVDGNKIENQKEICIKVDSFQQAELLLATMGCRKKAYQESKREFWIIDGTEITIDEWPFLEPYVEIEGKSEEAVKAVAQKLKFDYSKALFCSVDTLYAKQYNISEKRVDQTPEIVFSGENPFL